MVHQRVKDIIFYGIGFYSFLARPFLRIKFRNAKNLYLNIGCGRNRMAGFVNIDGNPLAAKDLLYDIRLKLPFKKDSVAILYAADILEHFYINELMCVLKEFYRVMQPGGVLRIIVPDLGKSIVAYNNKDSSFFSDYPRNFKSIGGRFVNFILCDSQHKTAFDFGFMKEILTATGFTTHNIHKKSFGYSLINKETYNRIKPYENHYRDYQLFVEAVK